MKRYVCSDCEKAFSTSKARQQHWSATSCTFGHGYKLHKPADEAESIDRDASRDVFECVAEDLPDGAYWAMAEEFGLGAEDFLP